MEVNGQLQVADCYKVTNQNVNGIRDYPTVTHACRKRRLK